VVTPERASEQVKLIVAGAFTTFLEFAAGVTVAKIDGAVLSMFSVTLAIAA
jgi:hypothetical protein